MSLKYTKKKVNQYTFTGKDFAQALYDADDMGPCKFETATGGHIYHAKVSRWKKAKLITVDEFTFRKIWAVLGKNSK